jgi:hypothetical protein
MVFDAVHAYRLEGSRPNMQRDKCHLDTLLAQTSQQRFIEMQTCGRRRNCPGFWL